MNAWGWMTRMTRLGKDEKNYYCIWGWMKRMTTTWGWLTRMATLGKKIR